VIGEEWRGWRGMEAEGAERTIEMEEGKRKGKGRE
jgi:hypothetical protein